MEKVWEFTMTDSLNLSTGEILKRARYIAKEEQYISGFKFKAAAIERSKDLGQVGVQYRITVYGTPFDYDTVVS